MLEVPAPILSPMDDAIACPHDGRVACEYHGSNLVLGSEVEFVFTCDRQAIVGHLIPLNDQFRPPFVVKIDNAYACFQAASQVVRDLPSQPGPFLLERPPCVELQQGRWDVMSENLDELSVYCAIQGPLQFSCLSKPTFAMVLFRNIPQLQQRSGCQCNLGEGDDSVHRKGRPW